MHEGHTTGLRTPTGALDHLYVEDSTSVSGRLSQASLTSAVAGFALMVASPLCPALPLAMIGFTAYIAGGVTAWTVVPAVMAIEDRVLTRPQDYRERASVLEGRRQVREGDQSSASTNVPH